MFNKWACLEKNHDGNAAASRQNENWDFYIERWKRKEKKTKREWNLKLWQTQKIWQMPKLGIKPGTPKPQLFVCGFFSSRFCQASLSIPSPVLAVKFHFRLKICQNSTAGIVSSMAVIFILVKLQSSPSNLVFRNTQRGWYRWWTREIGCTKAGGTDNFFFCIY